MAGPLKVLEKVGYGFFKWQQNDTYIKGSDGKADARWDVEQT